VLHSEQTAQSLRNGTTTARGDSLPPSILVFALSKALKGCTAESRQVCGDVSRSAGVKILQLAPIWETVPPPAYGGIEAVVADLCNELVRRGHEVTLCASGDSRTSAELLSIYPRSLRTAKDVNDPSPYVWMHAALSLCEGRSFDIIHNHAGELVMAMSHLVDVTMLTTRHGPFPLDWKFIWDHYTGWYNTISRSERLQMPPVTRASYGGVVYNGIDVESFPYSEDKDEYLLFLSRVSPEKGTHLAVEAAARLGLPLIIAGKVDSVDEEYFHTAIEPLIDGRRVAFVGEADGTLKRRLYARARCLLMPLMWEEPFGLVMVEAMACGTPVIAFPRGSAPELIRDGETGYLVSDVDEMVAAVRRLDRIEPRRCRDHVAEHFSVARMTDRYVALYERILGTAKRGAIFERAVATAGRSENASPGREAPAVA
jgi:glycosyltransferase involved in cell wall biosynthesis